MNTELFGPNFSKPDEDVPERYGLGVNTAAGVDCEGIHQKVKKMTNSQLEDHVDKIAKGTNNPL